MGIMYSLTITTTTEQKHFNNTITIIIITMFMNILRILLFMRFMVWRHGCDPWLINPPCNTRHPDQPKPPTPHFPIPIYVHFCGFPPQYFSLLCVFICVFTCRFCLCFTLSIFVLVFVRPPPLETPPPPILRCQFPLELILCLNLRIVVVHGPSSCSHSEWSNSNGKSKWTPAACQPPTRHPFATHSSQI